MNDREKDIEIKELRRMIKERDEEIANLRVDLALAKNAQPIQLGDATVFGLIDNHNKNMEAIKRIIERAASTDGVANIPEVVENAYAMHRMERETAIKCINELERIGDCYRPKKDTIKLVPHTA